MPIGPPSQVPEPKSGRRLAVAPMLAMMAAEPGSTAAFEMSVLKACPAGKGRAPLSAALLPRLAPFRLP